MKSMMRDGVLSAAVFLSALLCLSSVALAQEGPLDPAPPKGVTTDEIIRHFTTKEKEFQEAAGPVHLPSGRARHNPGR